MLPRVVLLRPMQYEVSINETTATFSALLSKEIDKNVKPFNNYESAKIKMLMQEKVPKMDSK